MATEKGHGERVVAVVAAGGAGSRFAGAADTAPKQFADLAGEPVMVRSIRAMLACEAVERVACAVPAHWRGHAEKLVETAALSVHVTIVDGGTSRQQSVARALEALGAAGEPDYVVIHDAVRPLVTAELVWSALDAARAHGAAVVATPAVDTTATRRESWLERVLDRSALVNIQTPQAFDFKLISQAHRRAAEDGIADASDDATLVLRLGSRVAVVPGPGTNIKITSPADLDLACFLLAHAEG